MFAEPGFSRNAVYQSSLAPIYRYVDLPRFTFVVLCKPKVESWLHPNVIVGFGIGLLLVVSAVWTFYRHRMITIFAHDSTRLTSCHQITPYKTWWDRYLLIPEYWLDLAHHTVTLPTDKISAFLGTVPSMGSCTRDFYTRETSNFNRTPPYGDVTEKQPLEIRGWRHWPLYRENGDVKQSHAILMQNTIQPSEIHWARDERTQWRRSIVNRSLL